MLVDTGTPAVNGGTKVPISGCVTAVVWAVDTGIAMVSPAAVGTQTPPAGSHWTRRFVYRCFWQTRGLVLVITSRIKAQILGHVVHIVFKK